MRAGKPVNGCPKTRLTGSRIIVCPYAKQINLRIQIRIHPRLDESAGLARIHAVAANLNLAFGIPDALSANSTMIGTKIFKARRVS